MSIYPNWLFPNRGTKVPPPPELPKYDPNEEAPKWNWTRLWYAFDPIPQHPNKPKTGGQPIDEDSPDWRGVIRKNVIPVEPPGRYDFGKYTPDGYFWFDTPDYADPFKKLKYALHFMTKYGVAGVCVYAVINGYPFTLKDISYLFRKPFAKFWIGGMTASLTVITLANLRGNKDDYWNWSLAGLAAGSVVGRKNHLSFQRQVMIWVPTCLGVKWNAETNGKIFPIYDFRLKNKNITLGSAADYGFWSGDLRIDYFKRYPEDQGRGLREYPR